MYDCMIFTCAPFRKIFNQFLFLTRSISRAFGGSFLHFLRLGSHIVLHNTMHGCFNPFCDTYQFPFLLQLSSSPPPTIPLLPWNHSPWQDMLQYLSIFLLRYPQLFFDCLIINRSTCVYFLSPYAAPNYCHFSSSVILMLPVPLFVCTTNSLCFGSSFEFCMCEGSTSSCLLLSQSIHSPGPITDRLTFWGLKLELL